MRLATILAVTTLLAPPALAAGVGASALPDGRYQCAMLSAGGQLMLFDMIEIKGLTFRAVTDGQIGPTAPYKIDGTGVILWGGPFGNVESDGTKVVSSVYQGIEPRNHYPFFNVTIETGRNTFHQMSCDRES